VTRDAEAVDPAGKTLTPDTAVEPKDSFDEILKRVVRSPVAGEASYDVAVAIGTELAGRFKIERVIGSGGMGTVYAARDQTLGREVAIKLHHAANGAVRLRREAVAMARLAHPNVVTVFEVGEIERHPFVVMEYVTGTTLRAWLGDKSRTVREILDMVIAAGQGLAAAHDAGLVHRDVKPENVLIGSDGRARVGDFGLARELDSQEVLTPAPPPAVTPAERLLETMTQTGAVLGTPAYMAPEAFSGAVVDARADQFAFCVTVWEALWGLRPFAGATFDQLHVALTSGERRPVPAKPRVPARVRAAIERGLSKNPSDRFPTMHALLKELREPLQRRRRLAVALVVGGAAVGIATFAMLGNREHTVSCTGAGAQLVALVPGDLASRLQALGATDAAQRVEASLAGFTQDLTNRAELACEAGRVRHDWSPQLLAKSESCLEISARTAHELLSFDAVTRDGAPDLVRRAKSALPALDRCTDPTYLGAMRPLPEDPAQLAALIHARAEVEIAYAELENRRRDRAQIHFERLAASPAAADPMIAAGLLMVRGMFARSESQVVESEKLLSDAYYAARAIDDDVIAANALTGLISLSTEKPAEDPASTMWLRTALADAERWQKRSPWLSGRIYLTDARVADGNDDAKLALTYAARALELLPAGDSMVAQAWIVEGAVMMWTGKVDEGVAMYDKAIAAESKRLGPDHPSVGSILSDYAASLLSVEHLEQALEVAERALKIIESSEDPSDGLLDAARVNLAAVLSASNHDDRARPLLEKARADYVKFYTVSSSLVANVEMNLAIIYMNSNEAPRAIAMLEEALATDERLLGKDRIPVADVLFNLAAARIKTGDLAGALAAQKRCVAIYEAKTPGADRHRLALAMEASIENDLGDAARALAVTEIALAFPAPTENPQTEAWNQFERARALIAVGRGREARPLIDASRKAYASLHMQQRLDQLDKLEAKAR
jgi:tetratricopeptide (TPR) repeat protein/predicted Ser/Thr protein kinase